MAKIITIILGSKSDKPVAEKVTKVLDDFEIGYELRIASAHRTPGLVKDIVTESTAQVFIAIAGLSAALPGVVAAHTVRPVIGVPVSGKINFDSILSIVQLPPGIPVAAVGLDNGANAAILALEIIGLSKPELQNKVSEYRKNAQNNIIKDDEELNQ